jgi:hypothetical protein
VTAVEQTATRTGSLRLADMANALRQRLQPSGRAAAVGMENTGDLSMQADGRIPVAT